MVSFMNNKFSIKKPVSINSRRQETFGIQSGICVASVLMNENDWGGLDLYSGGLDPYSGAWTRF